MHGCDVLMPGSDVECGGMYCHPSNSLFFTVAEVEGILPRWPLGLTTCCLLSWSSPLWPEETGAGKVLRERKHFTFPHPISGPIVLYCKGRQKKKGGGRQGGKARGEEQKRREGRMEISGRREMGAEGVEGVTWPLAGISESLFQFQANLNSFL